MIGAFVVGAVFLVVAGVLMFGSGKFLKKTHTYVMYFHGSVYGLDEGASVDFRGVKIGTVQNIVLRTTPSRNDLEIEVLVEIEPERIQNSEMARYKKSSSQMIKWLVEERGLRAQLQMQSLVTGNLMIELGFHPNEPIRLVGHNKAYPEIPTIPTPMEKLQKAIAKVPIEEIFKKLQASVEGVEKVINSPEVMQSLRSLNSVLENIDKLVNNVNGHVDPLLTLTTDTVRDTQHLVRNMDGKVGMLSTSAAKTIKTANVALTQAQNTLKTVEKSAGDELFYQVNKTLIEISDAARAIRLLADYLSRHPESLLRGKGGSE